MSKHHFYKIPSPRKMVTAEDVFDVLGKYRKRRRETIVVLHMRPDLKAFGYHEAASGTMSSVSGEMHDIFKPAIIKDAKVLIVAHNHPYEDDPVYSEKDERLTEDLYDAGQCLKIPVIDHVVLTEKSYFSFRESGVVFPKRGKYFLEAKAASATSKSAIKDMLSFTITRP